MTACRPAAALVALVALVAAAALGPADGQAASPGAVLVVGDSLEVGTGPYLRRELGSVPLTVDARKGRPSPEGVDVLRRRLGAEHRVVVFDLGVNDDPSQPAPLSRGLATLRELAGDRCIVVATLSRPPLNGVSIERLNGVIEEFVAATPGARLVDWHAATADEPALLGHDGVHPGPSGYAARAQLVAREIQGCLASGSDARGPALADAEPEPPQRRTAPRAESGGGRTWADLLQRTGYPAIAGYVRRAVEVVVEGVRGLGQSVGPRPPEPRLGLPKP